MAFTAVGSLTSWGSASSISAITFTGVAVSAGDTLVIGWCANVASLTASIADNSTQTGAANQYVLRTPLPGTTFTAQTIYCLKLTRAILTTDTITITLTGGPVTRSAARGYVFTAANGNAQLENRSSVGNAAVSPVAAPVMSTSQWVTNEMCVAWGFWKGGAVASGFANASANMTGAATVGSISSGGTTTRVEAALAYTVGLGTTAWTPSYTYTSITMGATEGLTFTDHARPAGCVQYHSFPRGAAVSSQSVEIGPCTAGNLLIMAVATNENAGADNITTPTGWNLAGTFRQGTTDVNIAVFTRTSTGGETGWTVTTSVAQRMQVHVSEWSGFTETQDGTNSTAGSTAGVTTYDSGTVTPTGAGRLFYAVVVEKNAAVMTEGGGFSQLLSDNEAPGTLSSQKLAMMVVADANRSTAAREQPTSGTAAGYAGMGFLFMAPASARPHIIQPRLVGAGR